MLYEFHKWQNDKKPGSLHATYLIYGTMKKEPQQQDGDVEMTDAQTSEHGQVPLSDEVLTQTLALVIEEQLQGKHKKDISKCPPLTRTQIQRCWYSMMK